MVDIVSKVVSWLYVDDSVVLNARSSGGIILLSHWRDPLGTNMRIRIARKNYPFCTVYVRLSYRCGHGEEIKER